MAKLWTILKNRKESRNNKRFYTASDMSEIKHDITKRNGEIKRGEVKRKGNEVIYKCGCGHEGCFIHTGYDNRILNK